MIELKVIMPNPCEHCQYSYDKETCDRGNRCKEWYLYKEIKEQRDADQQILNPVVEALEAYTKLSFTKTKEGDCAVISLEALGKVTQLVIKALEEK